MEMTRQAPITARESDRRTTKKLPAEKTRGEKEDNVNGNAAAQRGTSRLAGAGFPERIAGANIKEPLASAGRKRGQNPRPSGGKRECASREE